MAKRNNTERRNKKRERMKKKTTPPVGLITVGVGILLIGIAALFMMPSQSETTSNANAREEYSSVPQPVNYAAPELALENMTGKPEALEDYRGKIVLVNLWATWCPPCKAELPVLQAYYEDHVAEGFVIIGISSQEKQETVEGYISTTDVNYPIWIDEKGKANQAFKTFSLPASFIIDKEGTVRLAWTGAISRAMLEKHVTPIIEE